MHPCIMEIDNQGKDLCYHRQPDYHYLKALDCLQKSDKGNFSVRNWLTTTWIPCSCTGRAVFVIHIMVIVHFTAVLKCTVTLSSIYSHKLRAVTVCLFIYSFRNGHKLMRWAQAAAR